jgi:hypothetical protein
MFERPDLCIERVAHQAQPGTSNFDAVPRLLGHRPVGEHFGQCFVIPLLRVVQDHRHGLEITAPGCLRETLLQGVKMRGTGWRQRGPDGRCSRLGHCRCNTDRTCGHGQSERTQYIPSSGDNLQDRHLLFAFSLEIGSGGFRDQQIFL